MPVDLVKQRIRSFAKEQENVHADRLRLQCDALYFSMNVLESQRNILPLICTVET